MESAVLDPEVIFSSTFLQLIFFSGKISKGRISQDKICLNSAEKKMNLMPEPALWLKGKGGLLSQRKVEIKDLSITESTYYQSS